MCVSSRQRRRIQLAAWGSVPGFVDREAASAQKRYSLRQRWIELRFQRLFAVVNRIPGAVPQA